MILISTELHGDRVNNRRGGATILQITYTCYSLNYILMDKYFRLCIFYFNMPVIVDAE
jgi:hypothetical protein